MFDGVVKRKALRLDMKEKSMCPLPRKAMLFPHFLLQHANKRVVLKEQPPPSHQIIKIPDNEIINPILPNKPNKWSIWLVTNNDCIFK